MTGSSAALAWAAYLVAAWWDGGAAPGPAGVDPASVVALLRRNGVPLLSLAGDTRPPAAALLGMPAFRAALAEDRASLARQEAAFAEIQARWAAAGIPALFVKALGPQPTFPYTSSNLDILVPQGQQDRARKLVRDLGYVELRHIEEPNKFLFRRYHLGESTFDLHIHGRLEWCVAFLDDDDAWQRSRRAPDTPLAAVPAPEDGILITLAHAIYENKSLKLGEVARIVDTAARLRPDWEQVVDTAHRKGWLPGLWFALDMCSRLESLLFGTATLPEDLRQRASRGLSSHRRAYLDRLFAASAPPDLPVRIAFLESKRLFYEKMLADSTRTPRERLRDVVFHTVTGARQRLRLRSQRPLLIALDGIDGSGKSAQARLFDKALTGAALRHRVVWTRGGSSSALQPLLRLGKRILRSPADGDREPSGENREQQRDVLFRHGAVRVLWPWLIAIELGATYLKEIGWPLVRGEVVVADRYLLSALADLAARVGLPAAQGSAATRVLRRLAPRPRVSYWFDTPWQAALERQTTRESPELMQQQAALLRSLAGELGATRVDGAQPPDVISDRIVAETLRGYLDAHRTLLNGLFRSNPRPLSRAWIEER